MPSTATTTAASLGSIQYGPAQLFPRAAELPGRASERRRRARHVSLPRLQRRAVGRAVALPRRDRRGARQGREGARGVLVPLSGGRVAATSASSSTGRSSRATSSPTSASRRCGSRAGSSSRGSSSAASRPSPRASARRCSALVKEAFAPAPVPQRPVAAAAGAGVRERRAGDRDEAPVVRVGAERQLEDAVRPRVHDLARREPPQDGVEAAPAGADDERADAVERPEAFVVVVVAGEHDIGIRLRPASARAARSSRSEPCRPEL